MEKHYDMLPIDICTNHPKNYSATKIFISTQIQKYDLVFQTHELHLLLRNPGTSQFTGGNFPPAIRLEGQEHIPVAAELNITKMVFL